MTPVPKEIEVVAQIQEEARKQQEEGGGLDALSNAGGLVTDVAEAVANVVGGVLGVGGSVFDGL